MLCSFQLGYVAPLVDSRETALEHIGELRIPIAQKVISLTHVRGDLYDLVQADNFQPNASEITVFKNGGGAHLDLMMATYFLSERTKTVDIRP